MIQYGCSCWDIGQKWHIYALLLTGSQWDGLLVKTCLKLVLEGTPFSI